MRIKLTSVSAFLKPPIGPGNLYKKCLHDVYGDDAELVATIYCGDNYFSKDTEASTAEAIKLIEPYKPDLFFAGPGFAAGRYCEACGAMCKAVKGFQYPCCQRYA